MIFPVGSPAATGRRLSSSRQRGVNRWQQATTWHATSDSSRSRPGIDQRRREPRRERKRTAAADVSVSTSGGENHVASGVGPQRKTSTWLATSDRSRRHPRGPAAAGEHVADGGRSQQNTTTWLASLGSHIAPHRVKAEPCWQHFFALHSPKSANLLKFHQLVLESRISTSVV